jgi:hypothetical protein
VLSSLPNSSRSSAVRFPIGSGAFRGGKGRVGQNQAISGLGQALQGQKRAATFPAPAGKVLGPQVSAQGEGEMTRNRGLFLGVAIGLFGALAVLTARYVAVVLPG